MNNDDDNVAIDIRVNGQTAHATLRSELTVSTVDELKDPLCGLLNSMIIRIDLSNVPEIDSCGLQLLYVLYLHARQLERGFGLSSRQPQLDDLLNLYNLQLPDAPAEKEMP